MRIVRVAWFLVFLFVLQACAIPDAPRQSVLDSLNEFDQQYMADPSDKENLRKGIDVLIAYDTSDWSDVERASLVLTLGSAYALLEQYEEAVKAYELYVRLRGAEASPATRSNLGQLYLITGRNEQAVRVFESLLSDVGEEQAAVHGWLGVSYYALGNKQKSWFHVSRATQIEESAGRPPKEVWLKYMLAYHLERGDDVQVDEVQRKLDLYYGEKLEPVDTSVDGEYLPIIRVEPNYPKEAADADIEGYVIVEFTVTEYGGTDAIKVVEAVPASVFDQSAIRAVRRWKYKPRVLNGVAVAVPGVRTQLTYSLGKTAE